MCLTQVLAVLPGVTPGAVMDSKIGRMLRDIEKRSAAWGFDNSTADLAGWVIKKWKNNFAGGTNEGVSARESNESSKSSNGGKDSHEKQAQKETRAEKTRSTSHERNGSSNGADSAQKKRSNSVNHLRDLMGRCTLFLHERTACRLNFLLCLLSLPGSRNGKSRDVLGNALGSKRKLGPANAYRARRSTVVIDAVARRFTETAETAMSEKAADAEDAVERASRIRFGEPSVLEFVMEVEVSKLLSWAPAGRRPQPAPARPPPAEQPLKSILRVRLQPIEQVYAEPAHMVAPPTVQTVSISTHSTRQAEFTRSGSRLSDSSDADYARSMQSDDIAEAPQSFSTRREQTNRSPPPDFDDRPSMAERDSVSSLPESEPGEGAVGTAYEIEDGGKSESLPAPMEQGSAQPGSITSG